MNDTYTPATGQAAPRAMVRLRLYGYCVICGTGSPDEQCRPLFPQSPGWPGDTAPWGHVPCLNRGPQTAQELERLAASMALPNGAFTGVTVRTVAPIKPGAPWGL